MIGNTKIGQLQYPLSASLRGSDTLFNGISIDTRTLLPGQLYVAISGIRFDGHNYIKEAFKKGASGVVVENYSMIDASNSCLVVEDTRLALGQIGCWNRSLFKGCMIGLTGSSGKTSTREMVGAITSEVAPSLLTEGNLNNDYGVPLVLSRICSKHKFSVVEMGTNNLGEIGYLGRLVFPDIALVTNASEAHLSGLGSLDGVIEEKGAIFDDLSSSGIAVINREDDGYARWQKRIKSNPGRKVLTFGLKEGDCRASNIAFQKGKMSFVLHACGKDHDVSISFLGRHQVANACAAAAVGIAAGIDSKVIVRGLEKAKPFQRRGQCFQTSEGGMVIDESYNANPASTKAAIDLLSECDGNKILVLADMKELGNDDVVLHGAIGKYLRGKNITEVLTYGDLSEYIQAEWNGVGKHYKEKSELIDALLSKIKKSQSILIKGSMSMGMDEVVEACVGK